MRHEGSHVAAKKGGEPLGRLPGGRLLQSESPCQIGHPSPYHRCCGLDRRGQCLGPAQAAHHAGSLIWEVQLPVGEAQI